MSGSAGGNRISREAVAKTVDDYIKRVLSKFPGFRGAKISGSYNTSAKADFGDIDLIVNLTGEDKKNIKTELAKYVSSLSDDIIVPFKSDKYKGKKYLNTGEIITVLYPIIGVPNAFVQIDNIISISNEEAEFKKEQALTKALEEWKRKKYISDEEARLKIDFVKKYGAKEWEAVLKIKLDIENLERKANEDFQHDLKEIRNAQFWCFVAALIVTLWLKFILGVI